MAISLLHCTVSLPSIQHRGKGRAGQGTERAGEDRRGHVASSREQQRADREQAALIHPYYALIGNYN